MKQIVDLTGKKILVTGASSGIGRETAILLSQVGAAVVLTGRDEGRLQKTLEQMDNTSSHFCIAAELDKIEKIEELVRSSVERDHVKLDGLVHSAGIAHTFPLKMINYKRLDDEMRVNYYAFVELIKQLAKNKYRNDNCCIVGISSAASNRGGKGQTVYSATKAAMDAAVITLSKELAMKGMRINSIRPSFVKTEMAQNWSEQKGIDISELEKLQLLGIGLPSDIANLVAFLLSPAARFITGQSITIDGGG